MFPSVSATRSMSMIFRRPRISSWYRQDCHIITRVRGQRLNTADLMADQHGSPPLVPLSAKLLIDYFPIRELMTGTVECQKGIKGKKEALKPSGPQTLLFESSRTSKDSTHCIDMCDTIKCEICDKAILKPCGKCDNREDKLKDVKAEDQCDCPKNQGGPPCTIF